MKHLIITSLFAAMATSALASGPAKPSADGKDYLENGSMTYEVFERAVQHVDLPSCPAEFDPEQVFCRLTLASEEAHVWVFDTEGDQVLLAIKTYALDEEFLPF